MMGVCTARSAENDFTMGIGVSKFAMAPFASARVKPAGFFQGLRLTRGFFGAWLVANLRTWQRNFCAKLSFVLKSIGDRDHLQ
jgi:hypothetical protein